MGALRNTLNALLFWERFQAFITDIFMVYMPILYITTYFILGSKEALQASQLSIFLCFFAYAAILSMFFAKKSQTLGYMYARIVLVSDDKDSNIGFLRALCRFVLFCISMSLAFGLVVPFVRKDKRTFHDFVCKTHVIKCNQNDTLSKK